MPAALLLVVLLTIFQMFSLLHGDQPLVLLPAPTAQPNCMDSCGGIKVPYPFGIGSNCSFNDDLNLACDNSTTPPKLILGANIQVLDVNLSGGEIRVYNHIRFECFGKSEIGSTAAPEIFFSNTTLGPSFTFSTRRNMFTVIGCDTLGTFTGFIGKRFTAGCISFCADDKSLTNDTCDGIGCCQTAIPKGVTILQIKLSSFDNYTQFNRAENFTCSYAFLIETRAFKFSTTDVKGDEFWYRKAGVVPVVLDWALGNYETDTCESSEANMRVCVDGECYNSPDGIGFRCRCKAGYNGNPYLLHGCVDIDECADGSHHCENVTYCVNKPGSYDCVCPPEYTGDGRIHQGRSGCHLNLVVTNAPPRREQPVEMIIIATVGGFLLLSMTISWACWLYSKRKLIRLRQKFFKQNGGSVLRQLSSTSHSAAGNMEIIKIFTAEELRKATNNYHASNIAGKGGHGMVYKGTLPDKRVVAIKKAINVDGEQVSQFINEIVILYKMNHRNVVQLLGCCLETEAPLLVYEFVPNGTLFDHIHHKDRASSPLSFDSRLTIAGESAGALAFLHSASSIPIIHRDVKSANILLDGNFVSKISDFGASRLVPLDVVQVTTLVQGTLGYLDPEYFHTGQLSEKSDVYSFGVVLVELLTGAEPICSARDQEERMLSIYFISALKENRLFQVLADQVVKEGDLDRLMAVAELARRCLKVKGEDRPTMREVAAELDRLRTMRQHPWNNNIENPEETQNLLGEYECSEGCTGVQMMSSALHIWTKVASYLATTSVAQYILQSLE